MKNAREYLLELGSRLAKEFEVDEEMDDQALIDMCFEEARDGDTVRSMEFDQGSSVCITKFDGHFWGFDDAEMYGPFESFEEAESDGPSFWGYDEIVEDWTHGDYRDSEEN